MKLNRVFSVIALFGLLSGAGMAAQAQTRFMVRIGTPRAAVVASYAPQYYGNGNVWISGYFNGARWIPGYWARRMDSRYGRQNYYYDHAARFNNYYSYYGNNYNRNDRNFRRNRNDRWHNRNQRDHWNRGRRGWNHGRGNWGGRH